MSTDINALSRRVSVNHAICELIDGERETLTLEGTVPRLALLFSGVVQGLVLRDACVAKRIFRLAASLHAIGEAMEEDRAR